jgi:cytochrome c biogenesis protein CcmG/thiol:disulfide interchange protein DsbE
MAAGMSGRWRFLPLILFAAIVGAMVWRLATPLDTKVASKLAGKPVPEFDLPAAVPGKRGLSSRDLAGSGPRLVNIFASWCVPCATEASVLAELKRRGVAIDGIAIRDREEDLQAFLARHGDPFARIGADDQSAVQIALGSSGVTESFIVDGRGIIRYQHIGAIDVDDVPAILAQYEAAR